MTHVNLRIFICILIVIPSLTSFVDGGDLNPFTSLGQPQFEFSNLLTGVPGHRVWKLLLRDELTTISETRGFLPCNPDPGSGDFLFGQGI